MTLSNSPPDTTATVPPTEEDARLWLSALADGQAGALTPGRRAWHDSAAARSDWHAWHLIGDVMRSDELARPAAHDAAFVAALRERLAAEPVVLSPVQRPAGGLQRWRWPSAAAALAASVAVFAVLVVGGGAGRTGPSEGVLADGASPAATGLVLTQTTVGDGQPPDRAPAAAGRLQPAPPTMIRDARLDAYLSAHRAARGGGLRAFEAAPQPAAAR